MTDHTVEMDKKEFLSRHGENDWFTKEQVAADLDALILGEVLAETEALENLKDFLYLELDEARSVLHENGIVQLDLVTDGAPEKPTAQAEETKALVEWLCTGGVMDAEQVHIKLTAFVMQALLRQDADFVRLEQDLDSAKDEASQLARQLLDMGVLPNC